MPDKTRRRSAGGQSRPRRSGGANRSASRAPKKRTTDSNIQPLTPVLEPPDIESFAEFELGDETQGAIAAMGITKPTPIQALAIEPVLKGKDVIAKAETGTGKTLAFGAPMMAKIDPTRSTVLGLVLSPTRELAEQVHDVLEKLGEARGVKTALVVGGEDMGAQIRKIQAGAQVIVGTPGRVLDLLNQKFLQFPWTEFAILDEADKMLEIGFIDDVKKILDAANEYRQTLLFSATFPPALLSLARGYTNDPAEIATASGVATVDNIHQYFLRCGEDDRARNLAHLIEDSGEDDVFLVFCERRTDVDRLMRKLERRRFSVKALHGGYDQAARFKVMAAFRTGDVKCLVATDVASRGLDVAHVTHVVNLGVPRDVSDYTHRIGRTGRAGRHGVAVTFVAGRDERGFTELRRASKFDLREIERPRELFAEERRRAKDAERGEKDSGDAEERPKRSRDEDAPAAREERPRRRRSRDEDEERPSGRRRREGSEDSERPRRRRGRDDDEQSERPARRRREESEGSERPRRRPRRDEQEGSERPARRSRDDEDRGERPARRRRERSEREDEPRRGRGRDDSPSRPRLEREERPRREDAPTSDTAPKASREAAPEGGFGVGLEDAAAPEKPRRSSSRRGRKSEGDAPDSGTKRRADRPKKEAGGENAAAKPAPESAPGGGFGAGL